MSGSALESCRAPLPFPYREANTHSGMLILKRARVPAAVLPAALADLEHDPVEPSVLCDIAIAGPRIASVEAADGAPAQPSEVDLAGQLVFPAFVDAHVHLDKTHTWSRAPNQSATFGEALATLGRDKAKWTREDLLRRAGFALRWPGSMAPARCGPTSTPGFPGASTTTPRCRSCAGNGAAESNSRRSR